MTVVYLSASTAHSEWVKWEVEKSLALGKRVIAMHASDTPPATLPNWVSDRPCHCCFRPASALLRM